MDSNNSPLGLIYFSIPCFDQVKGKKNSHQDYKKLAHSFPGSYADWALVEIGLPGKPMIYFTLNKTDPDDVEVESEITLEDYTDCFLY